MLDRHRIEGGNLVTDLPALRVLLDSCGWVEAMEKKLHERELESGILRGLERACAWSEVPLAGLREEHCKLRASAIQGLQDSGGGLCGLRS